MSTRKCRRKWRQWRRRKEKSSPSKVQVQRKNIRPQRGFHARKPVSKLFTDTTDKADVDRWSGTTLAHRPISKRCNDFWLGSGGCPAVTIALGQFQGRWLRSDIREIPSRSSDNHHFRPGTNSKAPMSGAVPKGIGRSSKSSL